MGDKNTVSVLIYGQEYTLSGDMSKERIMKLASKVDETMKQLGQGNGQSLSKTAVLAAMLIANDYFDEKELMENFEYELDDARKKAENYANLWEEVKRSFAEYKENQAQTEDLLRAQLEEKDAVLNNMDGIPSEAEQRIEELENRCRDIESSFFDLQMENIRLKNELENYKSKIY